MFTRAFWKRAIERAVKSAAGTVAALWTSAQFISAFEIDWQQSVGVAGFAAGYSVLMSLASVKVGDNDDPSLV